MKDTRSTHLSYHTRLLLLGLLAGMFILTVPLVILYSTGYRLGAKNLTQTGGIYVHSYAVDGQILLDGEPVQQAMLFEKNNLLQGIAPGIHTIEIRHPDHIIWKKKLPVYSQTVTTVSPFLVPIQLRLKPITQKENPTTYKEALRLFGETNLPKTTATTQKNTFTPSDSTPVLQKHSVIISQTDSTLYASWAGEIGFTPQYFCNEKNKCDRFVPIFQNSGKKLKDITFYPDRDDLLIAVHGNDIIIFELDARGGQNTATLYNGINQNTTFRIIDDATIAIKDGKKLFLLSLQSTES